jgi:hypothetical protein
MVKYLYLTCWIFRLFVALPSQGQLPKSSAFQSMTYEAEVNYYQTLLKNYVELLWLTLEGVHTTQENQGIVSEGSPSVILFKKYCPEFDRTVATMRSFQIFFRGEYLDYLHLTQKQDPHDRLTYKTFREIQRYFSTVFEKCGLSADQEIDNLINCFILFCDVGKTRQARVMARAAGIDESNHDLFFSKVAKKNPDLLPSFKSLSPKLKQILISAAEEINFGHIAHLESGSELFVKLNDSRFLQDQNLFDLAFIAHMCDVAGSLGHVDPSSSLNYTQSTHQQLMDVKQACLSIQRVGPIKAWELFIQKRSKELGLDATGKINQVLLRLSSMMRFTTPSSAKSLKKALFKLPQDKLEKVLDAFSWDNYTQTRYMPAVILNLLRHPHLGDSFETRLEQTVDLGVVYLADMLQQQKNNQRPLINFNPVAKEVKEDPFSLVGAKSMVNEKGVVQLIHSKR